MAEVYQITPGSTRFDQRRRNEHHFIRSSVLLARAVAIGCTPRAPEPDRQAADTGLVCAQKAGANQSYWSRAAAVRDGAVFMVRGECPSVATGYGQWWRQQRVSEHGPSPKDATVEGN
jgi:hypothetical protein